MASKKISASMRVKGVDQTDAVPESRIHSSGNTEGNYDWSQFTINGEPIPEELWPNMQYHLTDQGHAERSAGPKPVTRVTRDAEDKRIDRFREGRKTGHLILGEDPLKAAMEQHLPPGHSGLWMGSEMCKQDGLVRGVLKFEPVMIDDGKGGKMRVEQGGMFLASVPQEYKDEADDYYAELSKSKQVSVVEDIRAKADEALHGSMKNLAQRKRALEDIAGIQVEDQDLGDEELAHELG